MLKLTKITKDYISGDETVQALKGVDIEFRANEFVAILGHSGCGKTTLLNIIGGLDRYTAGDLYINGVSTKDYGDHDWDYYRNHSVGFVFQSYNLISHQTVLANVELALTVSGISKAERRKRAEEALIKVGLGDQIRKKPNQLSGGQMQRVAIARALVNNPEILLADEPTGALDSETSVQVMNLLSEIAKDKLVIMVTHNPELAELYANRIIKLVDGEVIGDSNPYTDENFNPIMFRTKEEKKARKKKTASMSFFTALSLSLNNLMTKKARTFLTSFAGSIGIIGIALILSLSSGFQTYIDNVQRDTLSSYPISLTKSTSDLSEILENMSGNAEEDKVFEEGYVYPNTMMLDSMNALNSATKANDLKAFKAYIEKNSARFEELTNDIQYTYDFSYNIFIKDDFGNVVRSNPSNVTEKMMGEEAYKAYMESMNSSAAGAFSSMSNMDIWQEMMNNDKLLSAQYDLLKGSWPTSANQVVIVVSEDNRINSLALYSLGLLDQSELEQLYKDILSGEEVELAEDWKVTYEKLLGLRFRLLYNTDFFEKGAVNSNGIQTWKDNSGDDKYAIKLYNEGKGMELEVVGIVRPNEAVTATSINGVVGYTHQLTEQLIAYNNESEIVKQQLANPDTDVFTGLKFITVEDMTYAEVVAYIATLPIDQQASLNGYLNMMLGMGMSEEAIASAFTESLRKENSATYENNIKRISSVDTSAPASINLYPKDFESKEAIQDIINEYNTEAEASGKSSQIISYTDYIGLFLSSVSTIIDVISYVLIAFVSISLVVSSIMIGVITYISVLERTKEIGVLRSIGASKKDIRRVFNAETLIVGFAAGMIGILVTLVCILPFNIIIENLAGIVGIARLPLLGAIILIAISMGLTLIAGLIPSGIAAKKDPVVALRTE